MLTGPARRESSSWGIEEKVDGEERVEVGDHSAAEVSIGGGIQQ